VHKIETIWKKREKKKGKKRVQYLIKLHGYPNTFNSWIFRPDLQKHSTHSWIVGFINCIDLLRQCIVLGHLWKMNTSIKSLWCTQLLGWAFITWRYSNKTVPCGRPCWAVAWDIPTTIVREKKRGKTLTSWHPQNLLPGTLFPVL
jgi:hypothetical protein